MMSDLELRVWSEEFREASVARIHREEDQTADSCTKGTSMLEMHRESSPSALAKC